MSRSTKVTLQNLFQRAKKEPWTYAQWYFIEKPVMFWSWKLIVGAGGPFVYQVGDCIYFKYHVAEYTWRLSMWMYPVLLVSACFTILFLLIGFLKRHSPYCSEPGIKIVALLVLYFTAVHTVLAPLPRYSIPFHGCLFLLGTCGFFSIAGFAKERYLLFKQQFLK